jgi:hypothetical protein
MVHVSDMGETAEEFVDNPESKVQLGQQVKVRVKEVDDMHRINLSMRMDPATDKPKSERGGGDRGGRSGGFRSGGDRGGRSFGGPRRSSFGDRGPRRDFAPRRSFGGPRKDVGSRDEGRSTGPHFPTSRFVSDRPRVNRGPRKSFNE